jgi:TldD protein
MDRLDAELARRLSVKPVEVGRFDLVLSAGAMATMLSETLGPACELDRALGYEANAGGTSYLGPNPLKFLGTPVAAPLVTISAERSTPIGLATVKWDDEGVVPEDYVLVNKGTLVDYHTTREQAAWLAPWYARQSIPVRSHGCAMSPSALGIQMQHLPNLVLHPGSGNEDLEGLIAGIDHGLLVETLKLETDFQCSGSAGYPGIMTEIRRGKRIAYVRGAGFLFRSMDFWKNIQALGGQGSAWWTGGFKSSKGEPGQRTSYSVSAVPAVVKQQATFDINKKA